MSGLFQSKGASFRLRTQLVIAALCAVLPFAVRLWFPLGIYSPQILWLSAGGALIASICGMLLLRSMNSYPGVEGTVYIVPSFLAAFGSLFVVVLFARLGYARSLFLISFVLNIFAFYTVYFINQRSFDFTIGIVPGSVPPASAQRRGVNWVPISLDDDLQSVSAVAVDLRANLADDWDRRIADYALAGVPVYHIKHLVESLTGRVELEHLSENSFGSLQPISAFMSIKHVTDWLVALVMAVLLLPLAILCAIAIRIDSPGPAIFRQTRIGYRAKPFTVFKFRTMRSAGPIPVADAAAERSAAMTGRDDQRITRLGRFLRTTRIDELPQIINVLRGEMSWIGPRPEAEVLSKWYESEIPFYRYRHIVRPGITGWAQVNQGHVAEVTDVRDKLYYDFYYIKNFSPWIDLLIIARTVRTIVTGFGAK